ncbi:MAG: M14 family metallopeptidase [Spirochaetia bacterium]
MLGKKRIITAAALILFLFAFPGLRPALADPSTGDFSGTGERGGFDAAAPKGRAIGQSVEGRPLRVYRFGPMSGPGARGKGTSLVIYGGIHGGYEWNTVALTRRLIEHFSENPELLPEDIEVCIIPVVNPDGLHRVTGGRPLDEVDFSSVSTDEGRVNANGVDLNRNWEGNWEPTAYWRGREVGAGEAPFSEPETRALKDFILKKGPSLVISYHSAANGIHYAGKRDGWEPALRFARVYSEASGYPVPEGSLVGYKITGASTGYFYSKNIPALVVELVGRDTPEFERNLAGLKAVFDALRE